MPLGQFEGENLRLFTNKVLALARRREPRDFLDAVYLHLNHLHLGALAWASAGKDPGLTPEAIIEWGSRHANFQTGEFADLRLNQPLELRALGKTWMEAAEATEKLFEILPANELGCLCLNSAGQPVCPEPKATDFVKLTRHYGSVNGA